MALDFLSVGDRADSNMQVNEIMFKVQIYHVMVFVCKKTNFSTFYKVVLWITIEMTSCEVFMSMKVTKHWLKVLWKQHVLSHKQLT